MKDDLRRLGFKEHEIQVYLALLSLGKTKAAEVIQQTGLHRNLVYQALDALTDRRLVAKSTMGGVFRFQLTDPEHLRDSIREQELSASRVVEALQERMRLTDQEIMVYEGEDAIRTFSLTNVARLAKGERIYVLGSGGKHFEDAMGPGAMKKYFSEIEKNGAGISILTSERQSYSADILDILRNQPSAEIRPLPFDFSPSANTVFTDKSVAFTIFEKPQSVIEVRNAHLVRAYKQYFSFLWGRNVRIEYGMEALHEAFYGMANAMRPGESYAVLGGNVGLDYSRLGTFFDEYHRYRIQHGVHAKILAFHDTAAGIRERGRQQGDLDDKLTTVRAFQGPFMSPMQINLYNGKTALVLYKEEPVIIYFDDREVYDGFKIYFDEIWNRRTETLSGHEGIKTLCERVLEEGKDQFLIAATGTIMKTHKEYYKEFTKRRSAKGLRMHILANEDTRNSPIRNLPLSDVRYLPPTFASPMVIWIFGDYVANVLWHEPETIFLIHDAKTAEYYRKYYRALEQTASS